MSLRSNRTRTSHTLGAQAQPPRCCAQAKLKEQAKERQQVELAERKRVAAQQEAAWVKFEQERQAIAEVEKAEEAKARAEASAMRRLAMMSGREPKPSGTPVENLQNIIGGKGSKKQKARKGSKGGSACSKNALRSNNSSPLPGAHPRLPAGPERRALGVWMPTRGCS